MRQPELPGIDRGDEHDRRLAAQVHPSDWVNPEPRPRYHLVVVGAGTGGLVSAAIAAGLGARVALVERNLMGGDCLNVGCVPSKAVIRAARAWDSAERASERFGGPAVSGTGDFARVMDRMRRIRADLAAVDSAARFRELGVDVFLGDARFIRPDALDVDGRELRFWRAIIATGGRPGVPAVPGLVEAGYHTNESIFSLKSLPARIFVLGAGPIGCELAQAFARLGATVTVADQAERILPREPAEAAEVVAAAMRRDGVRLAPGAKLDRVERHGAERVVHLRSSAGQEAVTCDAILVAAGRVPNASELGLEAAGVKFTERGVTVDARMRTSNRRVFAIGDVASRYQFTHAADAQARLAVPNALFFGFGGGRADRLVMPWCTYTSPEVAHVGMDAAEADAAGPGIETLTIPLADVDRAVLDDEADGLLILRLERRTGRIRGGTLVAEHAGETIGQLTVAINERLTLGELGAAIPPYPTQSAVFRRAADSWRRRRLTPLAAGVLRGFFGAVGR